MLPMKDRLSVITGAAQGIGYATAHKIAERGGAVAIVDMNAGAVDTAVQRLRADGFEASGHVTNIAEAGEIEASIEQIATDHGRIDALINVAGVWSTVPFEDLAFEEWRRIFDVNTDGVFRACQSAYRIMKQAGYGRIVNISTGAFALGRPGMAHYAASKGAVVGLTRVIAAEGGQYGITANVVAPGLIATEGVLATSDLSELEKEILPFQSVKRLGKPDDIAEAIAFLVSPEAGFTSGQTLYVGGGQIFN